MKYLSALLCLFLCYQLSTQIPHHHFGKHGPHKEMIECLERSELTMEELEEYRRSDEIQAQLLNGEGDFKKYGCFLACIFQQHGLMEGSSLNVTLKEHHKHFNHSGESSERMAQFLKSRDDCIATAEDAGDECDVALAFEVCMYKNLDNGNHS
nr:uncharacterized protein LOC116430834 [Nomia melanderi]